MQELTFMLVLYKCAKSQVDLGSGKEGATASAGPGLRHLKYGPQRAGAGGPVTCTPGLGGLWADCPLLCFVPVFFRTLFPERQNNYQDPNCTCGLGFRNGAQKTTADAGLAAFKVYEEP